MRIPGVPTIRLPDGVTERAIRSLLPALSALRGVELLDGRLIEGLTLDAAGEIEAEHGLDRKWRGAFIVKQDSATLIVAQESSDDVKYVKFSSATAGAVLSAWVF